MKLISLEVKRFGIEGDGDRFVTLGFLFTDAEALDGMTPAVDDLVLGAMVRAFQVATTSFRPDQVSGDTRPLEQSPSTLSATGSSDASGTASDASAGEGQGRRRRRGESHPAVASQETPSNATEAAPPTSAEGGRRRRGSEPANPPGDAQPSSAVAQPQSREPDAGATPVSGQGRRRRGASADSGSGSIAAPTTASSPSDIKLLDLSKAASAAAERVTSKVVMDTLRDKFKLSGVNDAKPEQFRAILDALKALK